MTGKIIPFPQHIGIQRKVRDAQLLVEQLERDIEEFATSTDWNEAFKAKVARATLPMAQERLERAEAELEWSHHDSAMRHRGTIYHAVISVNGAH